MGCYKQREVECVSRIMGKEPLLKQVQLFSQIQIYERSKGFDIECLDKKLGDCGI